MTAAGAVESFKAGVPGSGCADIAFLALELSAIIGSLFVIGAYGFSSNAFLTRFFSSISSLIRCCSRVCTFVLDFVFFALLGVTGGGFSFESFLGDAVGL